MRIAAEAGCIVHAATVRSSAAVDDTQRLAEAQSRHLDGIASMTLGIVVLLSTAGAAFVAGSEEPNANALDGAAIFFPLYVAFAYVMTAVAQRTVLVPNPAVGSSIIAQRVLGRGFDAAYSCLVDTIRGNHIRNVALSLARLAILLAVVNFFFWISEEDPVEPSRLAMSIYESSNDLKEQAVELKTPDNEMLIVRECLNAFRTDDTESRDLVYESCTSDKYTLRLWVGLALSQAALVSQLVFFVWILFNRRSTETKRALRHGVLLDLERKARRRKRRRKRLQASQ